MNEIKLVKRPLDEQVITLSAHVSLLLMQVERLIERVEQLEAKANLLPPEQNASL